MVVSEAVEPSGGALGVSAHVLKVQPITDIQSLFEADALADAVNAITSRSPDAILDASRGERLGSPGVVVVLATSAEDVGHRLLVIKHDAAEVAIDTIVDVNHVAVFVSSLVCDGAAGNDVAGKGEGLRRVEATRLGHQVDARMRREVLVQGITENTGHDLEGGIVAEATAHIQGLHIEAVRGGLLEDSVRVLDGLKERLGVGSTGPDVEGNTDDIQTKVARSAQQILGQIHSRAELQAQAAEAGRIIGVDTQEELGIWEELGNLAQLVGVVESHLSDTSVGNVANIRVRLARLGVDDALRADSQTQDLLDLRLGRTVKAGAEAGQEAQKLSVRVALDSVEWLDAGEVQLPPQMLAVDLAEVGHEKGVFVTWFAIIMINAFDAATKGLADQLLGIGIGELSAVVSGYSAMILYRFGRKDSIVNVIDWCGCIDEGNCHNHIPTFD